MKKIGLFFKKWWLLFLLVLTFLAGILLKSEKDNEIKPSYGKKLNDKKREIGEELEKVKDDRKKMCDLLDKHLGNNDDG